MLHRQPILHPFSFRVGLAVKAIYSSPRSWQPISVHFSLGEVRRNSLLLFPIGRMHILSEIEDFRYYLLRERRSYDSDRTFISKAALFIIFSSVHLSSTHKLTTSPSAPFLRRALSLTLASYLKFPNPWYTPIKSICSLSHTDSYSNMI